MRTDNGNFLRQLPSSPMKHGAILLAQLAGNHARRAETLLTRSIPLWRREWLTGDIVLNISASSVAPTGWELWSGCCFFPLRKCIFSVAATFWVAKLDFLCCGFFSCLGWFFSCLGRVFSRLGRFFPAASRMHFFCCKGAFLLLQGVFSCCFEFFPRRSGIFC